VFAIALSPGHVGGSRSYPDCEWHHVWKMSLLDKILAFITTVKAKITGAPEGTQNAELILDITKTETNLYLDGQLALLMGRDDSYVVSYEGRDVEPVH
jgi:hypothetical protein